MSTCIGRYNLNTIRCSIGLSSSDYVDQDAPHYCQIPAVENNL